MKRKQKRFLQMTLLFTAALIFLPDIGLWSLYKEKHLVKPPEAAEPQVGAKPPGAQPLPAAAAPRGTAPALPPRAPRSGAAALGLSYRREKVVRASPSAGLGFPGRGKG